MTTAALPSASVIHPAIPIGLPTLAKLAFDGMNLEPLWRSLLERALADPLDSAALMDLSTIAHIRGQREDRLVLQMHALEVQRHYRQPPASEAENGLRLLALMVPGDFLANTPVEFLLEGSSVTLDIVYVIGGQPLPSPLPEHDVVLVAATELEGNRPAMEDIARFAASSSRPVLNAPDRIVRLTRDGTWRLLHAAPGVAFPINARINRTEFARIAAGEADIEPLIDGGGFPIIARPVDSHAGEGLVKLDDRGAIDAYLEERPEPDFFIAPFVDYRAPDGYFRKYRIALIASRPYACHMGISEHWMIHYLNAGMTESAAKRAEEARWMAEFDHDFAVRHAIALAAIADRIGLDYVTLDCGETCDGKLLVFEAGNGMIVHAMDSPELFPYKRPQTAKIFAAFQAMLQNASAAHRRAAAPPT